MLARRSVPAGPAQWLRAALTGAAITLVMTACGDDPAPTPTSAPVTPVTAAASSDPGPASQPSRDFPTTLHDYVLLIEPNPAGREAFIEEAIETLSEDIRSDPTNVDAYVKRGAAYTAMYHYGPPRLRRGEGDALLEQAVEDCTRAIDLDPGSADAYIGRGSVYNRWRQTDRANQDFDMAIELLSEAIRLGPNNAETYFVRGECLSIQT